MALDCVWGAWGMSQAPEQLRVSFEATPLFSSSFYSHITASESRLRPLLNLTRATQLREEIAWCLQHHSNFHDELDLSVSGPWSYNELYY